MKVLPTVKPVNHKLPEKKDEFLIYCTIADYHKLYIETTSLNEVQLAFELTLLKTHSIINSEDYQNTFQNVYISPSGDFGRFGSLK